MVLHDPLTGLPKSHLVLERTREALRLADRRETRVALVVWRPVGRDPAEAGESGVEDRILVKASRRLRDRLRASDLVGRTGESEFTLLLPGLEDEEDLRVIVERLSEARATGTGVRGAEALPHRAGAAVYPDHAARAEDLLARARQAVAAAGSEDSALRIYRPPGHAGDGPVEADSGLPDAEELQRAVEEASFRLVYQPVVRIRDRQPVGIEVSLRLPREGARPLTSLELLPALRDAELECTVDELVLERSLQVLGGWAEHRRPDWLSVNLALATVTGDGFPDRLTALLEETGIAARRLVVELEADEGRRNVDGFRAAAKRLEEVGAPLALDHVGVAPLPLAPLGERPPQFLKLDPGVVHGVDRDDRRGALVDGLVGLGHAVGARIVGEGIESGEELKRLARAGCDLAQGFHVGELRELEAWSGREP